MNTIDFTEVGPAWIAASTKQEMVTEVIELTNWSFDQTINRMNDTDAWDLIPEFGAQWWVNFYKRTA